MLNAIPVVGWVIAFVLNASMAVSFWIIWTRCGIGETYAYWLPAIYRTPGFWDCVGIFIVMGILKTVLLPRAFLGNVGDSKSSEEK